jgi:hypothetical protein
MDRHKEGFLMLTLFPQLSYVFYVFLFMSIGSFSNATPLKRGNGEMNRFLLFLNKDLSRKINPLYIHVHGYREKSGGTSCPLAFRSEASQSSALVTFVLC